MKFAELYRAIVHNEKKPPSGLLTAQVSQALQEHECAVARLNRIACDIEHGKDCKCCELAETKQ